MNIVCFGLSHRTAAVEVRERFAFADKELPAATLRLRALEGVREALILSTCNRVEHYAVLDDGPEPVRRASDLFRLLRDRRAGHAHADGETSSTTTTRRPASRTSSAWRAGWTRWFSARRKSSVRSSRPTSWRPGRARPRGC